MSLRGCRLKSKAYSLTRKPAERSPLTSSAEDMTKDFNVNTLSPYIAAQQAIKGFDKLPSEVYKTFLFTGNRSNTIVIPSLLNFGMTKGATWYMIQSLVAAYKDTRYQFYYVDERTPEGKGMMHVSGKAHANFFAQLAEKEDQGPQLATFVKRKGYTAFAGEESVNLPFVASEDVADLEYGLE